jgi:phage replication-related protein YjqB (UPF0714/DUF867 family)
LTEPLNYKEVLDRNFVPGRDLRIAFGDGNIARCLLVAPHGGGIEPGTSEILRAVVELGGWAWYEFAGFLRRGNKEALRIASSRFDEPSLLGLLPQTDFVVTFHGGGEAGDQLVNVGGSWEAGRTSLAKMINAAAETHGIHAVVAALHGSKPADITNRGKWAQGIRLEFSRGARNLLFPPDCSREARGRRSPRLDALAQAIHSGLDQLCRKQ